MKQTLVRILLFVIFFLIVYLLLKHSMAEAILYGFVATYLFEPAVMETINKP